MSKLDLQNWVVSMYDYGDNETERFRIVNRTEQQAQKEAMHEAEKKECFDWTMTKEVSDEY
jgi:hypothetical protein